MTALTIKHGECQRDWSGVRIEWDNGQNQFFRHNSMDHVEVAGVSAECLNRFKNEKFGATRYLRNATEVWLLRRALSWRRTPAFCDRPNRLGH
jgi:hypothetical protein